MELSNDVAEMLPLITAGLVVIVLSWCTVLGSKLRTMRGQVDILKGQVRSLQSQLERHNLAAMREMLAVPDLERPNPPVQTAKVGKAEFLKPAVR
jgi:hypothetical protein